MMRKSIRWRLVACMPILSALFFVNALHAQTYTFGVVPQQASNVLAIRWVPLTNYLSDQTGLDIRFATAKSIPAFEKELAKNTYDIAYMNPFHYTVFASPTGYDAVAMQANKTIKGIIVKRKQSPISTIADLTEQTIAFPAPAAFAATLLPSAELTQAGIPFAPRFVKSHDSVYLNVQRGFAAAGGGIMRTFNNLPDSVKQDLEVLFTTKAYTPHAFAVNSELPLPVRRVIQDALVNMHLSDTGKEILDTLGMFELTTAQDHSWDDVRGLQLSTAEIAK
jgi:phosphonate transport system substrate-binding protein